MLQEHPLELKHTNKFLKLEGKYSHKLKRLETANIMLMIVRDCEACIESSESDNLMEMSEKMSSFLLEIELHDLVIGHYLFLRICTY